MGALVLPATSFAQATRTWVSGTGDDVNPCSRTAPCKTFAGAITKTAAGGEIDAIDSAGYGALTITKSITISGRGVNASVLASNSNGFVITAGPNDRVNLIDLNFQGITPGTNPGLNGIRIINGAKVHLDHVRIMNFSQNGIDFVDNNGAGPQPRLTVQDSTINNSGGSGILVIPQTSAGERATVTNSHIDGNGCGISVGGTCGATSGSGNTGQVMAIGDTITDNGHGAGATAEGAGVESVGSSAFSIIGDDTVFGNTIGLSRPASGNIVSFGDNYVVGNGTNGSPSGPVTKMARRHPA